MERRPLLTGLLAVFVILVTIGGITRLLWIGRHIDGEGPMALAARPQGGFLLTTDHHVYTFDAKGTQTGEAPAATLGLQELGAAQVTTDGSTWLFDKARRQLFRCRDAHCAAFSDTRLDLDKNALFAVSPAQDLVAISDNNRHRLLLLDGGGRLLLDNADRPALHYPNQVSFDNDGLLIADSDRYEVLRLPIAAGPTPTLQPATSALATQRRPYRFARAGDDWWVVEAGVSLIGGKLYHYSAGGRTPVGTRATDIVDVLLQDGRLIVASRGDRQLLAIDPASGAETALGSPALRAAWQAQSRLEASLRRERKWLPLLMMLLLLPPLAGAALLQQQRLVQQQPRRDELADRALVERYLRGTPVALAPDDEARQALAAERKLLMGVSLVGLLVVPALCWLSAGMPNLQACLRPELRPLQAVMALAVPGLLSALFLAQRSWRRKSSRELIFEAGALALREDGRERVRAPLDAVLLSQTDLYIGNTRLPLYLNPQLRLRPFWPRELIRQLLDARRAPPPAIAPGAPALFSPGEAERRSLSRQRLMLRALFGLAMVPLALVLLFSPTLRLVATPPLQALLGVALAGPLAGLWIMERLFRRYLGTRLELGSDALTVHRDGQAPQSVPYAQVWLGLNVLVAGDQGVRLAFRRNNLTAAEIELFPLDRLRDALATRLPEDHRFATDAALYLALLRQGNGHARRVALMTSLAVVAAVAVVLLTEALKR